LELYRAASTPIERFIPVKADRSYYDGDWAYWGKRRGIYPGVPTNITNLLKRQNGKCAVCNGTIGHHDRVSTTSSNGGGRILLHERCGNRNSIDTAQGGNNRTLSFH